MEEPHGTSRTAAQSTICMGSRLYPTPQDSWLVDSLPVSSSRQRTVVKHGSGKRVEHRASLLLFVQLTRIMPPSWDFLRFSEQEMAALHGRCKIAARLAGSTVSVVWILALLMLQGMGFSGPRMVARIGWFREAHHTCEPSIWSTRRPGRQSEEAGRFFAQPQGACMGGSGKSAGRAKSCVQLHLQMRTSGLQLGIPESFGLQMGERHGIEC